MIYVYLLFNNGFRLVPPLGNVHLVFHSIIKALHLLCSVHIYQRLIKQKRLDNGGISV